MDVATADADRLDGYPNLGVTGLQGAGNVDVAETNVTNALEDDGSYLHNASSRSRSPAFSDGLARLSMGKSMRAGS